VVAALSRALVDAAYQLVLRDRDLDVLERGAHQVPHFHARYGDDEASVSFDGAIIEGSLPARSARFVREWALLHQAEL
jgi:hypothetical protein